MSYSWEKKTDLRKEQSENLDGFQQTTGRTRIRDGYVRIHKQNTKHYINFGEWIEEKIPSKNADLYHKEETIAIAFNDAGNYRMSEHNSISIIKMMREMGKEELKGEFPAMYDDQLDILYVDLSGHQEDSLRDYCDIIGDNPYLNDGDDNYAD